MKNIVSMSIMLFFCTLLYSCNSQEKVVPDINEFDAFFDNQCDVTYTQDDPELGDFWTISREVDSDLTFYIDGVLIEEWLLDEHSNLIAILCEGIDADKDDILNIYKDRERIWSGFLIQLE